MPLKLLASLAISALLLSCGGTENSTSSETALTLTKPQPLVTDLSLMGVNQLALSGPLRIESATTPPASAADVMSWAETEYAHLFPSAQADRQADPYVYRYYPETGNYIGIAGDRVYVLGPLSGGQLTYVGSLSSFTCRLNPQSCPETAVPVLTPALRQMEVTSTLNPRVRTVPSGQAQSLRVISEVQVAMSASPAYTAGDVLVFPDRLLVVTALPALQPSASEMLYIVRAGTNDDAFDLLELRGSLPASATPGPSFAPPQGAGTQVPQTFSVVETFGGWSRGFDSSSGLFVASSDCVVSVQRKSRTYSGVTFQGGLLDVACVHTQQRGESPALTISGQVGVFGDFSNVDFNARTRHFAATFEGLVTAETNLKIQRSASFTLPKTFKLGAIKVPVVTGVPFVDPILRATNTNFVVPLNLVIDVNGSASLTLDLTASRLDYFKVTLDRTRDVWSQTFRHVKDDPPPSLTLTGNGTFSARAQWQLGLMLQSDAPTSLFDSEASLLLGVGPEFMLNATAGASSSGAAGFSCGAWWKFVASLEAEMQLGDGPFVLQAVYKRDLGETEPKFLPSVSRFCAVHPASATALVVAPRIRSVPARTFRNVSGTEPTALTVPRTVPISMDLDGSSSSSGGLSTLRYRWTATNPAITFNNPGAARTTANINCAGRCTANERIVLTVTSVGSDPRTAEVVVPLVFDEAPVARGSAFADPAGAIILDASASADEGTRDGSTGASWLLQDGQQVAGGYLATGLQSGLDRVTAGTGLVLSLTDKYGQRGTATVTVRQAAGADAMTVAAMNCRATSALQPLLCNATGSRLPPGLQFRVAGTICSGAAEVAGGDATQRTYRCVPTAAGTFTAELWQAGAAAAAASRQVDVTPAIPGAAACPSGQLMLDGQCVTPNVTCTASQSLVGGSCVTRTSNCTLPQVMRDGVCTLPPVICTAPRIAVNGLCVTPAALRPDLVPSDVTLSNASVAPGGTVRVSWAIVNSGPGAAAASTTGVRILLGSGAPNGSATDTLANVPAPAIAAGGRVNQEYTLTVPPGTPAGSYVIVIVADNSAASSLNQTDTSNDFRRSAPLTVIGPTTCVAPQVLQNGVCTTPASLLKPDLIASAASLSAATAAPGALIGVSWTITNQGQGIANASTSVVRIGSSPSSIGNTNNLAAQSIAGLPAGASAGLGASLSAPSVPGTYYVWVVVDNFNTAGQVGSALDNDQTLVGSFVVNAVATSSPDLQVIGGQVSPATVPPGGNISAVWSILNAGSGAAVSSVAAVRVNQNSGSASGSNLTTLATNALGVSASQSQSANLTAPTSPGTYYVWVLADNFSSSGQSPAAAANDIVRIGSFTVGAVPSGAPDLQITNGSLTAGTASPGATLGVNWTLFNAGNGTAAASTTVIRINQSTSSAGGSNAASVNSGSVGGFFSISQSAAVSVPTTPGIYQVWVIADNFGSSGQSAVAAGNDIVRIGSFTVNAPAASPPSISSIGSLNGSCNAQNIVISGSNFTSGATVNLFDLTNGGSYPGRATIFSSTNQLLVPAVVGGASSNWSAVVVNPSGQSSSSGGFSVFGPSLSGVSPSSVPRINGSQNITFFGSGFVSGMVVEITDSKPGSPYTKTPISVSSNQFTISANLTSAAATWRVRVRNCPGLGDSWTPYLNF